MKRKTMFMLLVMLVLTTGVTQASSQSATFSSGSMAAGVVAVPNVCKEGLEVPLSVKNNSPKPTILLGGGNRGYSILMARYVKKELSAGLDSLLSPDQLRIYQAIPVEHPQHEEVAAQEIVPREALARLAEHRGDRRRVVHDLHVARLAALLRPIPAVAPFEVRHLLRQPADHLAAGPEGLRDERVTGRADFR